MATWDVAAWLPIADWIPLPISEWLPLAMADGPICWDSVWSAKQGRLFGPFVCDILEVHVDIVVSEPQTFDE